MKYTKPSNVFFVIILVLVTYVSFGQDIKKYTELTSEAGKLYFSKEYAKSAQKFSEAFKVNGEKSLGSDRYNAACSYALSNQKDSAFVQLFRIAEKGNYNNYSHITTDADLRALYNDKRWNKLLTIVKSNKEKAEANYDKPLVASLDSIYVEDQKYRIQIQEVDRKNGSESKEVQNLLKAMNTADSINLIKVQNILDTRGWLGPEKIGAQGNTTLFLVIQHADITAQEKYLPMMREAVKQGKARPADLALLEDRVALRQGKKQIYGSQLTRNEKTGQYYVQPLEDPDNVDARREKVGLGKLQDYISHWGLTWNVEEYKKALPEIEAMQKQ